MEITSSVEYDISATPTLNVCNLHPEKLNKKIYKDFYDDLNKNRKKDMTIFLHNLETVKLKRVPESHGITYSTAAQYNIDENIIEILKIDKFYDSIDHELLHLASCIVDKNGNIFSGFSQRRGDALVGLGLDEGYTALLDDRYFLHRTERKEKNNHLIYPFVKTLARRVEEFIGTEEMEDFYFTADLLSIVKKLSYYTSLDETIEFLKNMDYILLNYEQAQFSNIFLVFKKYSECMLFIVEAWVYRIAEGYINGQMNNKEYLNFLKMARHILSYRISIGLLKPINIDKYFPKIEKKVAKKLELKYRGEIKKIQLVDVV